MTHLELPTIISAFNEINACRHVEGSRSRLMSSYQCTGFSYNTKLTPEMCFPSKDQIISAVGAALDRTGLKTVFVATDKDPMVKDFTEAFPEVKVVHIDPWLPIMDIVLLAESKEFIGNCVSSFSAFVWRHRLYHNKGPTTHFGL